VIRNKLKSKLIFMNKLNFLAASLLSFTIVSAFTQNSGSNERIISKADLEKAGNSIPASSIGEPVSSVKLYAPRWIEAAGETTAYGVIEGSIFPVDPKGWPINFRVLLPSKWSFRSIQQGGGGMNGSITVREGRNPMLNRGFILYGSDSGHQAAGFGGQGTVLATGPENAGRDDWALNDEAIKNLGYMQMKKTHDAVMVIIERVYGMRPRFNYYIGGSQGGREGLMVAQRYPADYDGIISDVPIVSFSTLMLVPELIRIAEKPLAAWVTPAKVNAIRNEFLRQCDNLDGLSDGMINNYLAARAIFNVNDGVGPADPWAALRAPEGKDSNPDDKSISARLTDGQINTLEMVYSQYKFPEPFSYGSRSFGMWLPTISPDDFGTITGTRYQGQEGAGENAQVHSSLGTLGVTGFMMKDVKANPLDYPGDVKLLARRKELSEWLDATNPDLRPFYKHGGKIIITVGTMDFIASSGAQIDYYQSLVDKIGLKKLEKFARLYVVPHGGHGLSGKGYKTNGNGEDVEVKNIPAPGSYDKIDMLISWVEEGKAPAKTLIVSPEGRLGVKAEGKGYLLCSYPEYPKYIGGSADKVSSWVSSAK
jgi:hypothetical protein